MSATRIEDTARRQNKLFELAHKEALEIKPVGIRFRARGIDPEKPCGEITFLPLPFAQCEVLSALTPAQRNVLSAMFFASVYRSIADAERRVTWMNMRTAERSFKRWSDEYFVLHQETNEEYDHIHCFANIVRTCFGSAEPLGAEPFVFACDEVIRPFSAQLDDAGWGAFYLLHRLVANIALKRGEAFLFHGMKPEDADPLAWEINRAHLSDEARHLTTSMEMGLGLYERAGRRSREIIKAAIRAISWMSIEHIFSTRKDENTHGSALAHMAIRYAFAHPAFATIHQDADGLIARWRDWQYDDSEAFAAGKRWYARELGRVIDALEIKLPTYSESVERMKSLRA